MPQNDKAKQDFSSTLQQAIDLVIIKMVALPIYSFTTPPRIGMFCQNQYDYGDANSRRLQQTEWICKGNIPLTSHTAEKQTP